MSDSPIISGDSNTSTNTIGHINRAGELLITTTTRSTGKLKKKFSKSLGTHKNKNLVWCDRHKILYTHNRSSISQFDLYRNTICHYESSTFSGITKLEKTLHSEKIFYFGTYFGSIGYIDLRSVSDEGSCTANLYTKNSSGRWLISDMYSKGNYIYTVYPLNGTIGLWDIRNMKKPIICASSCGHSVSVMGTSKGIYTMGARGLARYSNDLLHKEIIHCMNIDPGEFCSIRYFIENDLLIWSTKNNLFYTAQENISVKNLRCSDVNGMVQVNPQMLILYEATGLLTPFSISNQISLHKKVIH